MPHRQFHWMQSLNMGFCSYDLFSMETTGQAGDQISPRTNLGRLFRWYLL